MKETTVTQSKARQMFFSLKKKKSQAIIHMIRDCKEKVRQGLSSQNQSSYWDFAV